MRPNHPLWAYQTRLEAEGRRGPWVALFDIDSTLMDTAPRNAGILAAALDEIPGLEPWKDKLILDGRTWNILDPLHRAGIQDANLLKEVERFWKTRFFTDEWVLLDEPYPGVAAFLHDLKASGFRLAYLTGRHANGMERGTRESFVRHGLPGTPAETFFFKPDFDMPDREFKESVCQQVADLGTLVVSVDNEPANVNLFRRAFPQAWIVWLDTVTSPDPEELKPGIERRGPSFFLDR